MYSLEKLKSSTLVELREIAKEKKISSYLKLKKEYLIEEIWKIVGKEENEEKIKKCVLENKETDFYCEGYIEILGNYGFLRCETANRGVNDVYVSQFQIAKMKISTGDHLVGIARWTDNVNLRGEKNKVPSLIFVSEINNLSVEEHFSKVFFDKLVPIFPNEKIILESDEGIETRIIDLFCPIGKGTRGLIVASPKVGKTTLLKKIAKSILKNNKNIKLVILLIDERPEEVTEFQREVDAEVIHSTFDEHPENHIRVAKMVIETAKRNVEANKDVVFLLDSLTRLTRASNLTESSSGRTLSGGLDPNAFLFPKKFFGAARNIENGGSLTILATALANTGSKMDDLIFEEFKGTGNMELALSSFLSEKRIFPSIDIIKTATRKDEMLLTSDEKKVVDHIRNSLTLSKSEDSLNKIIKLLEQTKTNEEFVKLFLKKMKEKE